MVGGVWVGRGSFAVLVVGSLEAAAAARSPREASFYGFDSAGDLEREYNGVTAVPRGVAFEKCLTCLALCSASANAGLLVLEEDAGSEKSLMLHAVQRGGSAASADPRGEGRNTTNTRNQRRNRDAQ